ncbi:hypothetical protein N2152v2_006035 [Parachlorella kessleri]
MAGGADIDGLIKQYTSSKKEREILENYADLFTILKATEKLERAWTRDAISAKDYEPACEKLIAQFKTLYDTIRESVPDVEQFMITYNMQCPMAATRLLKSGMAATKQHDFATQRPQDGSAAVPIAETVQHFITTMDSLKLNMVAVDEIYPLLSDLVQALGRVPGLPPTMVGKQKAKEWMTKLHGMAASYQLNEEEVRQLLFDLESAYNEFISSLPRGN